MTFVDEYDFDWLIKGTATATVKTKTHIFDNKVNKYILF